ncbi:MAG: leucine-rich repeat protein [Alloprevotella sp.]|nr:leucine-rich repeat protein [Alloprevotella sp.]
MKQKLLTLCLLLCAFATVQAQVERYDLSGDTKVNVGDVTTLVNMILGKAEMPPKADLNGDGQVNVGDATTLINVILQKQALDTAPELTAIDEDVYTDGTLTYWLDTEDEEPLVYVYANEDIKETLTQAVVPAVVKIDGTHYTVTNIADLAFQGCTDLTSVTIPATVARIGQWAFNGCQSLKNIPLHPFLTSIGTGAFAGCSALTSVTIPASVESIGEYVFSNCPALEHLTVAEGNHRYDSREGCNAIVETATNTLHVGCKSSLIPASVTAIANGAFYYCTSLQRVDIPASIESIGSNAFSGCKALESIRVDAANPVYDSREDCNAIILTAKNSLIFGCNKSIVPATVTSIGGYAFAQCAGLTGVTLPEGLTGIGAYAFSGCTGLKSVIIPASVVSIGESAFGGCAAIESISVAAYNKFYDSRAGCNAIVKTDANEIIMGCKNTLIPNSVTSIGQSAFSSCNSLERINIPNSVTNIGISAFGYCTALKEIRIGTGLLNIGNWAFENCTALKHVTALSTDNAEYKCGAAAFEGSSIHSATLHVPAGCAKAYKALAPWSQFGVITDDADDGIQTLTTTTDGSYTDGMFIYYKRSDRTDEMGVKGPVDKETMTHADVPAAVKLDGKTYPVTNLGYQAFGSCSNLKSVSLPNTLKTITSGAFTGCTALESIDIPAAVTQIETNAFFNCSSLKSVVIPSSVTEISNFAFQLCSALTAVSLPASVKTIGIEAFYGCKSLKDVTAWRTDPAEYNCDATAFDKSSAATATLHVPAGSTDAYKNLAPWSAFGTVEDDIMPVLYLVNNRYTDGTLTYIFSSTRPGEAMLSKPLTSVQKTLTSVAIPAAVMLDGQRYPVTSINTEAFQGCTALESVSIPNSVTEIKDRVFGGCSSLKSIFIPASVANIGERLLAGCTSMENIVVDAANANYDSREGCNAIIETETNALIAACKTTIIPKTVTAITHGAFSGCKGLTAINIPTSVTSIGGRTFENCEGLKSILIPASVNEIDIYAFTNCTSLESIILAPSAATIGNGAFSGCSALTDFVAGSNTPADYNVASDCFNGTPIYNGTLHVRAGHIDDYKALEPWNKFKKIVDDASDGL